jgi:hypothetical protein
MQTGLRMPSVTVDGTSTLTGLVTATAGVTTPANLTTTSTGKVVSATRVEIVGGISWSAGAGSPEGAVTAPVGSLYSNTSGGASTSLYVKESGTGNTGWKAVVAVV